MAVTSPSNGAFGYSVLYWCATAVKVARRLGHMAEHVTSNAAALPQAAIDVGTGAHCHVALCALFGFLES